MVESLNCKRLVFPRKPFFARVNKQIFEGDTVGEVYSRLRVLGLENEKIRTRKSGRQLLSSDFKKEE